MQNKIFNIYISRFFSCFNPFLFIPFYAVWLNQTKLLSAINISIVTSLMVISLRSASLLFAGFIRKYQKKQITTFSLLLIITVFLIIFTLAIFHISFPLIWYLLSLVLGALIAITSLALLSAIALHVDASNHRGAFAHMNIALNLSSAFAKFIGAYVIYYDSRLLPLAPILFSLIAIYFSLRMPKEDHSKQVAIATERKIKLSKWPFIGFVIANLLTFVGFAQFYDVFAIFAKPFIDVRIVGVLFFLSGVLIALLQTPLTKMFHKVDQNTVSVVGNLLFGLGIFLLLFASKNSFYLCFLGVIILSIGEIIFIPTYQAMAVNLYPKKNPVMALAIMLTGWGIGESLGTFFGVYTAIHKIGEYSYIVGGLAIFFSAFILYFILKPLSSRLVKSEIT